MSQIYTTEIPVRNLLGVEDAGLVTESRSIPAGQGILHAGCLLEVDGTKSTEATLTELRRAPHGVLAFDTDTGPAGTPPVTVYLAGSFLFTTESLADDGFISSYTSQQVRLGLAACTWRSHSLNRLSSPSIVQSCKRVNKAVPTLLSSRISVTSLCLLISYYFLC